jgi:hypothetical protein
MSSGFFDNLLANTKNTISGWGSKLANDSYTLWDKTKKISSSAYSSTFPPSNTVGGSKTRRHKKRHFGGVSPYTSNNMASNASPFKGDPTALPHDWVGGKKRKTKAKKHVNIHKKHKKSYRHK